MGAGMGAELGAGLAGDAMVEIDYAPRLSRLLTLARGLLVIPQLIVLYLLGILLAVTVIISWFTTVITGRYLDSLFDFNLGIVRWRLRVGAYQYLTTDRYPPFSLAEDLDYPVRLTVLRPERVARWRPLLNWLLVIPAQLVSFAVSVVALFAVILAWFAILVIGRYPRPLFRVVRYSLILSAKTTLYQYWLTARYPLG